MGPFQGAWALAVRSVIWTWRRYPGPGTVLWRAVRGARDAGTAGYGLEDGDVILSVHGRVVTTCRPCPAIFGTYGPTEPAPVVVLRDHKTVELQLHANGPKEMGDH
jgi:hypothetical protein